MTTPPSDAVASAPSAYAPVADVVTEHKTVWLCVNEPGELIPEPCGCCRLPRCGAHLIPDCSPLLNGCSWRQPAEDTR